MCRVLGVSRSGYYAWKKRGPSLRTQRDAQLVVLIKEFFERSRGNYGSPRICSDFDDEGISVGHNRIARLMRENGIVAKSRRKWVATTDSKHSFSISPNLLNREFKTDAPNKVWVGDITYVRVYGKWTYLATVIDLFSRKIVGWAYDDHMKSSLVVEALKMAIFQRDIGPGLIFHSDRGSQYACHDFRKLLTKYGMLSSMSRKGNCWDNAVAESFFSTIKRELLGQRIWKNQQATRMAIFEYLEVFYNRKRKHSKNGMLSPEQYENCSVHEADVAA